ncbi:hypothetical protein MRB53_025529 [Persea americana]|uniref:Uncharacterized protein n=1 Tax=Persea americana TaxID=3435 RepID=A0ACC2LG69_PERAE|nr:hypothetical protein MRB53_025529 [Persea americana]
MPNLGGSDVLDVHHRILRHRRLEFRPRRYVHAPVEDPLGLESTGGSDVEIGDEFSEQRLVRVPAGGCSFRSREKVTRAAEILGLDEVEALQSKLASRQSVQSAGEEFAEDGEIHGAGEVGDQESGRQRRRRVRD